MSETAQISDLQTQINTLNASHTEYANYVQNYKQIIATAITNQGVETTEDSSAEVMAENIEKILQARTSSAIATEEDIVEGKTAWVNVSLVTGKKESSSRYNIISLPYSSSINIKNYTDKWEELTTDNFFFSGCTVLGWPLANDGHATYISLSRSYNASTGVLTVSA